MPERIPDRTKGFTLPREYYTSAELFELDMQKVFFTQWLYVGHESQIPKCGDFLTYEVGAESIVISRTEEGNVCAFFNVCRHRGARILQESRGCAQALRCPYHNWVYGLDGTLKSAPGMNDQLKREHYSLYPVWVETWQGLIYINLSQEQPTLTMAEMLHAAEPAMNQFRLREAKIAKTITYPIPANWKIFMENYRECYHCLGNHPEFCRTVPVEKIHEHRRDKTTRHTAANFTFTRYALSPEAKTQSLNGDLVSVPFGDLSDADANALLQYALMFYPAHAFAFGIDHGMVFYLNPLSAAETLLTVHWYVNADAVEGRDYDPDKVAEFWDITHRQDIHLCTINQQGVSSRRYTPGPYSRQEEDDIDHLLGFYLNTISHG